MDRPNLSPPTPQKAPPEPVPPTDDAEETLDWAHDDITGEDLPIDPGVSDDPGGDWVPDEDPWDLGGAPLPEAPDDEEIPGLAWDDVDVDAEVDVTLDEDALVARLPEPGIELEAIFDLSRPDSAWITRRDPRAATRVDLLVEIGVFSGRISVLIESGPREVLILGRDALVGR